MGRPVLERSTSDIVVECRRCRTHLAAPSDLISKLFQGSTGRASLYVKAINLDYGAEVTRSMTTGVHVIREASCRGCGKIVGWTYVKAYETDQTYKEGKVILERALVMEIDEKKGNCLDDDPPKEWIWSSSVNLECDQLAMRIG